LETWDYALTPPATPLRPATAMNTVLI